MTILQILRLEPWSKATPTGPTKQQRKNDAGDNETWVWYGLVPIINIFGTTIIQI